VGVIANGGAARAAPGATTAALPAVLLYRLIGYWAVLLAGAICYLSLRRRRSLVTPASGVVARTCLLLQAWCGESSAAASPAPRASSAPKQRRGCHIYVVSTTWLGHPRFMCFPGVTRS
jgi:hypothetical protein